VRALPAAVVLLVAGSAFADARIEGRVTERGSINPIAGVHVTSSSGAEAISGPDGRFIINIPAGKSELVLSEEGHETLHTVEQLADGQGVRVDYQLVSKLKRRYEAVVRGEQRHEGERFELRGEELQRVPGTSGDPFRIIQLLPGVATPIPLLPLLVIRGAAPGTNGFFLDGMRVPQIYHLLPGENGVVNGRIVDRIDFYPGTYDVSFGRYAGGVVDAETRPARGDGQHAEAQLSLWDASVLGEFKLPKDVKITVAGHYAFPSYLLKLFDNRVNLDYGDYQFRLDWKGLTIEALGSIDDLHLDMGAAGSAISDNLPDKNKIMFHRVQIRDRERVGRAEIEAAIVAGEDELESFGGYGVRKWSLGWRFNAKMRWKRFRLFVGTDGEVSRFTGENFGDMTTSQAPDELGDLGGSRDGQVAGAFVNLQGDLIDKRLTLTFGGRVDVYHAGSVTLLGLDPRGEIRFTATPWLRFIAGVGLYQQPPSFPVPLPGIDTFALQLGLQRAIQSSVTIEADLPKEFLFKATGYYSKFYNVNDVLLDFAPLICTSAPPESLTGVPASIMRVVDGTSYGMELMLRRRIGRFVGWIAYTLSRSEREYSCGTRPSDFDQSHLLNVVVQVQLPWKLMAGARLYYASGRPYTQVSPDAVLRREQPRNNERLPDYVQLDLRIDREWTFKRWALDAFIEILNVPYSQTTLGVNYPSMTLPTGGTIKRYDMPQIIGFHWILPTVGLRGRF
jgi:hypothetical protein